MTVAGQELDRRVDRPRIARVANPTTPPRRRMDDRIGHDWAVVTGLAWVAGTAAIVALSPEPADPEAASALADGLGLLIALGLSVGVVGLATGYRFGLAAAAATGGALLAMSLACPLTGHHAVGAWWLGELAIVSGLTGLGIVGYRRAAASDG